MTLDKSALLDRAALDRALIAKKGLHEFTRRAWPIVEPGVPFKDNWSIGAICEHLTAIELGQIRKLVINVPPGCMKSRTTGTFWPVWSWIADPSLRFGFWSFDGDLTLQQSRDSIALIQSEWFQERWPGRIQFKERDPAAGLHETSMGGMRLASSIEGKSTGRHLDRITVDDPVKPQTMSKVSLEGAKKFYKTVLPTRRKDPITTAFLIIMQRLHCEDLAGIAEADGYEVLRLPMRFESKFVCSTSIGFKDPRTEEGELLFPSRYPEAIVKEIEESLGPSATAAQLQQRPTPEGGLVFQRDWFRTWYEGGAKIPESLLQTPNLWTGKPAKFDLILQSWDCAFKDTKTADYVVGQVWGRKGGQFFLLDQIRERLALPATIEAVRAMTRKWPMAIAKLVEDKANGPAVIQTLKNEIPGLIEVNPEGGKEARANAVAPLFAAGNVYHPDPQVYRWVDQHREELATFPFAANDDTVDACTQALLYMQQRFKSFLEAMAKIQANQGRDILKALVGCGYD